MKNSFQGDHLSMPFSSLNDAKVVQWCCSLGVCSNNIFLWAFIITWPSSWTETNGGFPAGDFYCRVVVFQSIFQRFTETITACGSRLLRKTSIIFRV